MIVASAFAVVIEKMLLDGQSATNIWHPFGDSAMLIGSEPLPVAMEATTTSVWQPGRC